MLPVVLSPEEDSFRDEVRQWLAAHLVGDFLAFGGRGGAASDEGFELRLAWEKELARGGWLGLGFPTEYGGRGASITEQIVFAYEYAQAKAPYRLSIQGTEMIGPTIVAFGTEAQKRRFLPDILQADVIWCQGFSEPGAGSDLASVRTTAVRDGDSWVLEGQKVWTTFGHHADWIYVLCRTDAEAPKHKGLSMLLVPMKQPGVEVRQIRNIAGASEFCETFFDGARTDADLVVGEVNGGWRVALGHLGFERGTAALPALMQFERELDDLLALARARGRADDPVLRQRLAEAWIGVRISGFSTARKLGALLRGDGTLGPESSIGKLYDSTWHQKLCELKVDILGPEATLYAYDESESEGWQRSFLLSRAETIYGGASQIQRNTLGERVLGLPREPR
ncbi:MAG: acyl-CoA dehydrogenase family protein [Acidobacteria bacterium]|nr:acyl-CoA dehydrogenase family protein [Acidobacteriota bacterium]